MTNPVTNVEKYRPGQGDYTAIEKVVVSGDLSGLNPQERVQLYQRVCRSLGVNPYTRPLVFLKFGGSLVLYATARCTQQIAMARGISFEVGDPKIENGVVTVLVKARDPQGRQDVDIGAIEVPPNAKPYEISVLVKKCVTQAKRRVILSMYGLGWADNPREFTDPHPQDGDL